MDRIASGPEFTYSFIYFDCTDRRIFLSLFSSLEPKAQGEVL